MLSFLNGSFVDEVIAHPLLNIPLDCPALPAGAAVFDEIVERSGDTAIRASLDPDLVDVATKRHWHHRPIVENYYDC